MNTFLPYFRSGKSCHGALSMMPQTCRDCCAENLNPSCQYKCETGLCVCREHQEMYLHQPFDEVVHIFGDASGNLNPPSLVELTAVDRVLIDITYVVDAVRKYSVEYDTCLLKLVRDVREMSKKISRDSNEESVVKFKKDDIEVLMDGIDSLSVLSERANEEVNAIDLCQLSVPKAVRDFIDAVHNVGYDAVADARIISLEALQHVSRMMADSTVATHLIPFTRYAAVRRVVEFLADCKSTIECFNQWVHDANHYMSRLRKCVLNTHEGQMICGDFWSAEALVSALVVLKKEINEDIGVRNCPIENLTSKDYYRPYKLFHRFRYCYFGEGVRWDRGSELFDRKAIYPRGVESIALNLYANAIKYLSRYPGDKVVATEFIQQSDSVRIGISSYGPVVPSCERDCISNDGFRASNVREVYPGKGKGLARVRRICERAGYQFRVEYGPISPICPDFERFTAVVTIPESQFLD